MRDPSIAPMGEVRRKALRPEVVSATLPALTAPRLLDQLRERIRFLHYSRSTEQRGHLAASHLQVDIAQSRCLGRAKSLAQALHPDHRGILWRAHRLAPKSNRNHLNDI